jgi:hypothetical protein
VFLLSFLFSPGQKTFSNLPFDRRSLRDAGQKPVSVPRSKTAVGFDDRLDGVEHGLPEVERGVLGVLGLAALHALAEVVRARVPLAPGSVRILARLRHHVVALVRSVPNFKLQGLAHLQARTILLQPLNHSLLGRTFLAKVVPF